VRRLAALIAGTFFAACASAQTAPMGTFQGRPIVYMPFVIAGGKTVDLATTDAGPIPAENDRVVIQAAGFRVEPSKENHRVAALTWVFGFKSKTDEAFDEVLIEEVSPSPTPITYIRDSAPTLDDKLWLRDRVSLGVTPATVPWLYSTTTTVFVFKFTIKAKGAAPIEIYQPAWFPQGAKEYFLAMAARLNSEK
jgi:hypothetical protein